MWGTRACGSLTIKYSIMETTKDTGVAVAAPRTSPILRKVGVEIECIADGLDSSVDHAIRATGADIKGDGSIEANDGSGYEIATKPQKGVKAEQDIEAITDALASADAMVNDSCGLHIHADASIVSPYYLVQDMEGKSESDIKSGQTILYVHRTYLETLIRSWSSTVEYPLAVMDIVETRQLTETAGWMGDGYLAEVQGIPAEYTRSPASGKIILTAERKQEYRVFAIRTREIRAARRKLHDAMRFFGVIDGVIRSMVSADRRRNSYCRPLEKMARVGGALPRTARVDAAYSDYMDAQGMIDNLDGNLARGERADMELYAEELRGRWVELEDELEEMLEENGREVDYDNARYAGASTDTSF